jgi:hypothetical protein
VPKIDSNERCIVTAHETMATAISIDIGLRNFAFCKATFEQGNSKPLFINEWKVINITGSNKMTNEKVLRELATFMKDTFPASKFDINNTTVLIEQQFFKNTVAYVACHMVMAHFISTGVASNRIHLVNSKNKGLPDNIVGKKRKNKTDVRPIVESRIKKMCVNGDECTTMLNAATKKDDLQDCFLQLTHNSKLIKPLSIEIDSD